MNKSSDNSLSIKIFDTRNEMIKFYCNKISNPKLVEIGVFKGEFLDYLASECNYATIDAVDLFNDVVCSGDVDGNNIFYHDIRISYWELKEKYKNMPNIKIHKSNSVTFLQNQENNTYDIIYLDGDHSYEGVKQDLITSYNKIKNGGYIMGHDYEMNMKKAPAQYYFGVNEATNEFCVDYNQSIIAKGMDGCVSFCIQISKFDSDINEIINKTYTWGKSHIKFLNNCILDAFGEGFYNVIGTHSIIARFGGRQHSIVFSDDYTSFTSTRKDDSEIITGTVKIL